MKDALRCLLLMIAWIPVGAAETHVVVIQGLAGEPRFGSAFSEQSLQLQRAADTIADETNIHLLTGSDATRDQALAKLAQLATQSDDASTLILYLIGHGSWDNVEYKFNLPGPDLTATDLGASLAELKGRQVVINSSSASGALLKLLAAPQRVLITATRSGNERHATRFGQYLTEALTAEAADTNKDSAVSAEEAFLYASDRVAQSYETDNQLATEHAEQTGDNAAQILLARLRRAAPPVIAGSPAVSRAVAARDEVRSRLDALRLNQGDLAPGDYQQRLRQLLLELALAEDAITLANEEVGQ